MSPPEEPTPARPPTPALPAAPWARGARSLRGLVGLPHRPPDGAPPVPGVEVSLTDPVPGAAVRLLPGLLVLACGALLGPVPGIVWFAVVCVAVIVVWRPAWPAPAAFLLLVGAVVWAGGDLLSPDRGSAVGGAAGAAVGGPVGSPGPEVLRAAALVLGVHLVVRLTALACDVAWGALVEAPVLLRVARSVLGLQITVQVMLLSTVWLRSNLGQATSGSTAAAVLRLVAVTAAVAAVLIVLPRGWLVRRPLRD